ncbi:FERM, ARHGEF and pleckstrin domain-containing protein 1 [Parasteatoda tepidariorum]|uniref:FERM, ARHGEF and pleckstrin domain-containing protein 1 n=1 Tax=Parasteatoda tepidariorum TaxID=114398 RepID=UPI0039BC9AE5
MTSKLSKSSDLYEPSHRRSKKFMNITVFFLDDSSHVFQLQAKTLGQLLFEKVCKHINLLEVDYFGLECEDEKGKKYWLDVLKPLCSQLHSFFPSMYFCVKFYTPDPVQLEDEFTRYLFGLQIKKDFISGALQCNDSTAAVLLSYIVQADLGDFNPEVCIDHSYLTKYKFVAYQDEELEKKIMENHRKIIGQTPAEADLNLLERARRCELYRVRMTFDKDHEGVPLNLAVVHLGVLVFQNFTKINTFSWAKIRKLSFKRKKFLVKLHPEGYGFYKDTVEFVFDSRNECKNFWKKCIENHTFFRCSDAKQGMRMKPKIFSRGSSFRYSGRTQKQVSEFVRQNNFQKTQFQRSTSCRTPTSPTKSISSSIVPQPLLPVTSSSCGSMSDVPKDVLLPPKSTSEPTTPHTAPDFGKISNGSANVSGVVSPESDLAGFQSPEFCMQDTDDNISHDSYHVLDTNQAAAATNTDNPSTNKEIETVSDFKEDDGKSKSTTNILKHSRKESLPQKDEEETKKKSHRHRIRVYSNHVDVGQTSPILYARANRHQLNAESECKAYPRTVDFVLVNQLPAIGSFSYRDDSVELKSPSRLKLELFHHKWRSQEEEVRENKLTDRRARSKSQPLPLGVDLLTDFLSLETERSSSCHDSRKETAIKVISDSVGSCKNDSASGKRAQFSAPKKKTIESVYVTDTIRRRLSPESVRKSKAYQHMVYLGILNEGEFVDRTSHYGYNTYKFSQIGRPPELLASCSAQSDSPIELPHHEKLWLLHSLLPKKSGSPEKRNSVGEIKDNSALNPVAYNNNLESVKADNNNTESIETLKIDSKTNDLNILESSPTDSLDLSSQDMNNLKQILLSQEQDGISLSSSDNLSYNENILSQELKNYKNVLSDSYFRESSKNSSNEETLNNSKNSEHVFGASTFYVSSSPYSAGRLSSKRKVMNDRAYCLAKELLMTERTYRKDLEVVNVTFRDNYYSQKDVRSEAIEQFLSVVDPLHEMHCFLLRDLEQRLAFWEGRPVNKNQNVIKGVANILYAQKDMIKMHSTYLKKLPKLLEMLYDDLSQNQLLNQFYQQFETQKVCYLPLSSFLLRPAFRLVYYHSLVKTLFTSILRLFDVFNYLLPFFLISNNNFWLLLVFLWLTQCLIYFYHCIYYINMFCFTILSFSPLGLYDETKTFCESFENIMLPLVNYSKLVELQRSFTNFSSLVDKNRKFIREGCLSKFIKSGTQQCMFFLFSDILLCTLRTHDGRLSFKVQGLFPLKSLKIQETGDKLGFTHCFILCSPEKHLYLASPSSEEHTKWMRDLQNAIASQLPCKSSPFSLEEEEEEIRDVGQHINTSIHICWHRNISISCADLYLSMKNSLSGYLLRKFKNSSGWQKVWVVLANLCLFFYRSYLDESPLASLPLAGYKIMTTSSNDLVSGDCIFKLIFKNHEYFFMVENKYAFKRWMEVIHSCTLVEEENTHL